MTDVTAIGIPSVQVALNNVKSEIGAVKKDQKNLAQNFNFRGVDAVVNAAAPALNKYGIVITPELIEHTYETVETGKNRTPMAHVMVTVAYHFYGPGGDCVTSTVLAEAFDSGDKCAAKAMSVAYRIALLQTLNLPTTDPDPDESVYERSGQTAQTASSGRRRENAQTPLSGDWAKDVYAAKTVEKLREVWKAAGAAGALNENVVTRDGEKMTVQELLYRRNDEIVLPKSTENAPVDSGADRGA